jgi:hypothetical protein
MSQHTAKPTPDDVVARLRDASAVPDVRFDTGAVLSTVQRAQRRRRRRQALVGVAAAGVLALTVAGPLRMPGVGTVTMPGGHELRTLLGVVDADAPAPPPGIDLNELLVRIGVEEPSPETMASEVERLQTEVFSVLLELQVTWYESDSVCQIITYERGTFSDDGTCGGRPGEQPFDDVARADLDRLLAAVDRSGVPTDELANAAYGAGGRDIWMAGFLRAGGGIEWVYQYIYSPRSEPPEYQTALGPTTVTPIEGTDWYFEKAPND